MAFNNLCIEMNQMIAAHLNDQELTHFVLVCKATAYAIQDPSFWRARFLDSFENPGERFTSIAQFREHYQWRRKRLRVGDLDYASEEDHSACVAMVKDMLLDANPTIGEDNLPISLNFQVVKNLCRNSGLIRNMMREATKSPAKKWQAKKSNGRRLTRKEKPLPDIRRNLRMVLLLLSAYTLDIVENGDSHVYDFPESQRVAYAAVSRRPIFKGLNKMEVDTDWALHLVNFFRGHVLRPVENTLHRRIAELALNERPQMWNKKLSNSPSRLGEWWKGTYAFLEQDEVRWIRNKETWNRIFQDKNVDSVDAIQMVRLWVPDENTAEPWNPIFERHLKSTTNWDHLKKPNALRPQHRLDSEYEPQLDECDKRRSYRFEGLGYDDEEFYASGWINPMPSQRSVPDWNRITMMKYFKHSDGSLDIGALWAYEGVILPGGKMIIGRWWAADPAKGPENQYSGPFILWNVDASEPEPDWAGP